jgi:glyoxylase-like metal-dependent hydrolase (beta-lactamase superfamily II)
MERERSIDAGEPNGGVMNIYPIQTGIARLKPAFHRGNAQRTLPATMLSIAVDTPSIDVPIYAWLIEHPEGFILVDTGENAHTRRTFVADMLVKPEEEVGAQLERLGVKIGDITKVILTHLHEDHLGGIETFRHTPVFVSDEDYRLLNHPIGRRFSSLVNPIPRWFHPSPVGFRSHPVGAFTSSAALTKAADVFAVPTPGHTRGHLSVIVQTDDLHYFLAGDVTYSETSLLSRKVEGISFAKPHHLPTIEMVLRHVETTPTVYLPSHDWDAPRRLSERRVVTVDNEPRQPDSANVLL